MKLWTKILIGVQALVIIFMMIYAHILASEAAKQNKLADENAKLAVIAQQDAERQADLAARNAAIADVEAARAKEQTMIAVEQTKIAAQAQAQIAELKKALARCR